MIYFEPVLQAKFLVSSVGPREKREGVVTFSYPDGSIEKVSRAKPDFFRLEAIRIALENKN